MKLPIAALRAVTLLLGSFCAAEDGPSSSLDGKTADEQLLFSTTRIESKSTDGKNPPVFSTGFFVRAKTAKDRGVTFLVTCRHALAGFDEANFSFSEEKDGKPQLGQIQNVTVKNLPKNVYFDSDPAIDVAVIPMSTVLEGLKTEGKRLFHKVLLRSYVPDAAAASGLSCFQQVLFIGYPNGLRDEKNSLPIARNGFTATPYVVDYNGLPMFLIDATVFPGSSGSPVLVFNQGTYLKNKRNEQPSIGAGTRIYFLGMISQAYFKDTEGEVEFKRMPTAVLPTYKQRAALNLGGVIKAKTIFGTIDQFLKANGFPTGDELLEDKP